MVSPTSIFEQMDHARWRVGDFEEEFPFTSVSIEYVNRLSRHSRLYKDLDRIDDLGAQGRVIQLTSEYYNGAKDLPVNTAYPDAPAAFNRSFLIHEIGELLVPTEGWINARALGYKRVDTAESVDACVVSYTWWEDCPDDESARDWQGPAASSLATKNQLALRASFADLGLDGDPLGELQDFADQLVYAASRPEAFLDSIDSQVNFTAKAFKRVERAFSQRTESVGREVASLLTDPFASRAGRLLRHVSETVSGATASATSKLVVVRTFPKRMSILEVGAATKQDFQPLIPLNSGLNLLAIPAQTPVKVYARGGQARR